MPPRTTIRRGVLLPSRFTSCCRVGSAVTFALQQDRVPYETAHERRPPGMPPTGPAAALPRCRSSCSSPAPGDERKKHLNFPRGIGRLHFRPGPASPGAGPRKGFLSSGRTAAHPFRIPPAAHAIQVSGYFSPRAGQKPGAPIPGCPVPFGCGPAAPTMSSLRSGAAAGGRRVQDQNQEIEHGQDVTRDGLVHP